jgi:phosphate-selective porin OprO/OprP
MVLASAGVSRAGDSSEELRALIEQQGKQIQELKQELDAVRHEPAANGGTDASGAAKVDDAAVKKIVADYLKEKPAAGTPTGGAQAEDAQKKAKQGDEWYRVGSLLDVTAKFDDNHYLWLSTPNKDFTMHIGSWVQYDNVFFAQDPLLRLNPGARPGHAQGVATGVAEGGIGDLEDGTYFRRIRPFLEGTFSENYEYRLNLALENDQFETAGLDEFWVAANKIPIIGTVRVGHVKDALGLEADMSGSSRTMTFMERSAYSESIELNQNFVTGIWFSNNFFDQHATYTATMFRPDNAQASGAFFGDGQWGAQVRLTALPLYEDDGRCWLHLGVSGGWRNGVNNIASSPDRVFQLRARPELRDDDPAGSAGDPQVLPDANSNRMIDTSPIVASRQFLLGTELLYVRGPFSVQAEYGWNWIDEALGANPSGYKLSPAFTSPQAYMFSGGYVQLAYTLTGESRAYDRRYGTLAREYFRGGPFTNAWFLRDENGNLTWGWGAWEIAGRYTYVNLNDGDGLNRIQGGRMDGITVGLNWYLNSNLTCMFDWVYDRRMDVPIGTIPGYVSGFGTRVQLSF